MQPGRIDGSKRGAAYFLGTNASGRVSLGQ
jgi:hypothetical protein